MDLLEATRPYENDGAGAVRAPMLPTAAVRVGLGASLAAFAAFVAVGPHLFCQHGDAPSFLRVARSPFGTGRHFPDAIHLGVAYRFGRILYPLSAWLLAAGRPAAVPWTLAIVFAIATGAWFTAGGTILERSGVRANRMLLLALAPFALIFYLSPVITAEPLALAFVLFAYVFAQNDRDGAARLCGAAAILARETAAVALVPLAFLAWKREGWAGLARWAAVAAPYAAWTLWVRVRVGQFPFLDPSSSRRAAIAPPFVGWIEALHEHPKGGCLLALAIGAVTLAVAVVLVVRRDCTTPVSQAAIATGAFVACYGRSVWQYPFEGVRILGAVQVLLFLAILTTPVRNRRVSSDSRASGASPGSPAGE